MERHLELEHQKDLSRIYELFSVLRDYYKLGVKRNKTEQEIGIFLKSKIGSSIYQINLRILKKAILTTQKLIKCKTIKKCETVANRELNKLEIGAIKENNIYFSRMIQVLKDIYLQKNVINLKNEIQIMENDSDNY
tara:strand:- start:502 stop:909 length:408 start_codon:yes stop_codon:yes gene_type:complete